MHSWTIFLCTFMACISSWIILNHVILYSLDLPELKVLFIILQSVNQFLNYSPGILTPCKRNICSIGSDIFIFRDYLPLILKVSQTVMYDVVVYMKNGLPLACDSSLEKSNNSYAFSQCSLIQCFISVFCITHWSCFLAGLSSHTRFSQLITLLMYLPLENLAFIIRRD